MEEAFDRLTAEPSRFAALEPRDRAFAYRILATTLRRLGQIDDVLARFIRNPLPAEASLVRCVLATAVAQVLFLDAPPHAALSLSVSLAKSVQGGQHLAGFVNAVLRRVATEGPAIVATQDAPHLNTPDWLWKRWCATYGEAAARAIAARHLQEPPIDLTVRSEAALWAERLGGIALATGSVRLQPKGRINTLPGYADGRWWVQDAAAALPVRLLGSVAGQHVADLCAAPGGKTAQLAALGAHVVAVDSSGGRLERLRQNLVRLSLSAEVVEADAATWQSTTLFDGILLDAPCLATGTIRRHPDILHLKHEAALSSLTNLQARLIDHAVALLKPGGRLVYCTCSLEPEEGPDAIRSALARHPVLAPSPIAAGEAGCEPAWMTPEGFLRTLPCHMELADPALSGMDGFFAARLVRMG